MTDVADDLIRHTIARYQETFSTDDREGWLALFADDAVLEDPVGTPPHEGRAAIAAFWDDVHGRASEATVRMVQGPAVCAGEAAWAFQLMVRLGEKSYLVDIVDHGTFDADGRITGIRAFWDRLGSRPA
jgi:steroid delta-isomerase